MVIQGGFEGQTIQVCLFQTGRAVPGSCDFVGKGIHSCPLHRLVAELASLKCSRQSKGVVGLHSVREALRS